MSKDEKNKLPGLETEDETDRKFRELSEKYIDDVGKQTGNFLGELVKEMINSGTQSLKKKIGNKK